MGQGPPSKSVLVLGWNGVGKTAVVHRICGRSSEPWPTTGVIRESCTLSFGPDGATPTECALEIVDVGSAPKMEAKTVSYVPHLADADGLVVVLDATRTVLRFRPDDVARSKELLRQILAAQSPAALERPVLVLANKCDREDAIPISEVMEIFELESIMSGRVWHLQRCSAVTAEGVKAGVFWLVNRLTAQPRPTHNGASPSARAP
eukprot:TRINITY_DN18815_c1_g1_i1.p2 TRINITY_DN18815_c1_g1~~TRINITY_DN18815_c1_g1_i1.p2  ORF type:complete len:206 (-),score=46.09 TRINITY_DN18815_c1_g1_i1:111-728(-)